MESKPSSAVGPPGSRTFTAAADIGLFAWTTEAAPLHPCPDVASTAR